MLSLRRSFSPTFRTGVGTLFTVLLAAPVFAQATPTFTPQGRPTAGVQVGTPAPDARTGITFERQRIKRTAPLKPISALAESRWDLLYSVTEPNGPKVAYFDWDRDNLYIAWESPAPEPVHIDLDGAGDGFLRGTDNLRIQVAQPQSQGEDTPTVTPAVTAELWDGSQNGDHPTRTTAPLPTGAIQAVAGRTTKGTYVVMLAIGKTELVGLPRTPGHTIGLRIESGPPLTGPDGTILLSNRPLLPITLADHIEAIDNNLRVTLKVLSGNELVPGDGLRAVLEARNEGKEPLTLTRLFLRGSQASLPYLDSASFTGVTLLPGQSTKRELRSTVSPDTPVGTHVLTGGAERETSNGSTTPVPVTVAALASFDRVEPYFLTVSADKKPIRTKASGQVGATKTVLVAVHSRVADTVRADVSFHLPTGWSVEGGEGTSRLVVLRGDNDVVLLRFKVQIPGNTPPGQYVLEATATIEEQTYSAAAPVLVQGQ